MTFDLTYISLGGGVQSSAVLAMSALGLHGVPRADAFGNECEGVCGV